MGNKNYKLTVIEAKNLIWDEIMEEVEENFTREFQAKVYDVIKKIREAN